MKKTDLDRLRNETNIVDLAKKLGLQVRGRQARCYNTQAHKNGDKNPSLGLDVKTNRYQCFACGVKGSVFDLYMAVKGVDFNTALEEINNGRFNFGDTQPTNKPDVEKLTKVNKPLVLGKNDAVKEKEAQKGTYAHIYEALVNACTLDKESTEYLTGDKRGLTQDTLKRFKVFSVTDYAKVNKELKETFSIEELRKCGLYGEKENLVFYKHKVVTPLYQGGKITFLQGRNPDGTHPKYLGLTGVPKPMFNVDILAGLRDGDKVYICEGIFDAMRLTQEGYNAVAILGVTDFKPEEVSLFNRFDVILALDNDEAGRDMTQKIAVMFLLSGKLVKEKKLPEGTKDITDYFLQHAKQTV